MQLLIIADDFTGALDVSVQFAKCDVRLKVISGNTIDNGLFTQKDIDILVIDTETRHQNPSMAAATVSKIIRTAKESGVTHFYLKVDSGLRGNVGATLSAALEASGETFLAFAPAYPEMQRVTKDGVQYFDGTPIHKSAFHKDPIDPVLDATITDLFHGWPVEARLYPNNAAYDTRCEKHTVGIFDVASNADFYHIACHLRQNGQLHLLAGCAAFALVYQELFPLKMLSEAQPLPAQALLVLCGSLNPTARRQLAFAQSRGFEKITLTRKQQLEPTFLSTSEGEELINRLSGVLNGTKNVIIETSAISDHGLPLATKYGITERESRQKISEAIAARMGEVLNTLLKRDCLTEYTIMIVGGDTLLGVMQKLGHPNITVRQEVEPGIVLFTIEYQARTLWMISKAGSFGDFELLHRMTTQTVQ
jgi:D-threonate/D-erythronate kinase